MLGFKLSAALAGLAASWLGVGAVITADNAAVDDPVTLLPVSARVTTPIDAQPQWRLIACLGPAHVDLTWGAPMAITIGDDQCATETLSASLVRASLDGDHVLQLTI